MMLTKKKKDKDMDDINKEMDDDGNRCHKYF